MMTSWSPIIYQGHTSDVILLDLPRSIEDAQSSPFQIRSTLPPAYPYPSTEPKGAKLTRALQNISSDRISRDSLLEQRILAALNEARMHVDTGELPWCYPRLESANENGDSSLPEGEAELPELVEDGWRLPSPVIISSTERCTALQSPLESRDVVVLNPRRHVDTCLQVGGHTHLIPPQSAFIWSTIARAKPAFKAASEFLLPETRSVLAGQFDLILLDPPWSNRSVRRSRKYATDESQPESPFFSALSIVKHHLGSQGVVAIWITNKQAVGQEVLSALSSLGLHLQQEWVWVKVTSNGIPVTELHGVWRKPYERLLLFGHASKPVSRRFIIAVPDIHSRKPSFKRLFDEILPDGYRALELFARYLTAGWWAWGDQVLHFQNVNEWNPDSDR